MTVLQARGLTRTFGSFVAVADVNLSVEPGEVVGLLGANGAGKTTLLRMLLGLLPATSGLVALFGAPPTRRERRRVGYVPQNLGLYRDLTVAENLAFRAQIFGTAPGSAPAADRLIGELPLGLQRRVAFVAATQHEPDLLILDEPTSGVSPLARSHIWGEIRNEAERGAAVLVSTHYLDEAEQADRLVIMAGGKVAAEGKVPDVVGSHQVIEITAPDWRDVLRVLDRPGRTVLLAGRAVRVLGEGVELIGAELLQAGLSCDCMEVPATLTEVLVSLDSATVSGVHGKGT